MIHIFRQGIALKPAAESFEQGWKEALRGETLPISELWAELEDIQVGKEESNVGRTNCH